MVTSTKISIGIFVIVAIWLASGFLRMESREKAPNQERPLPKVLVRTSVVEDHKVRLISRGFSEADRTVDIRAEVSGRVTEIMVSSGDFVEEGQVLMKLSLRDKKAKLDEAKAALRQKQLEYEASKKLNQKNFRSDTALASSKAELNEAEAQVAAIEREIEDTVIKAPFSGILEAKNVEIGTFADIGTILCTIVDLDPILAVINVSELEVKRLKLGQPAKVQFSRGDQRDGVITFISRKADENTRSFEVELSIKNEDFKLEDGLSLEATIPVEKTKSHKISPAILTLDTDGRIGVKSIDEEHKVIFYPVEVVDSNDKYVWVKGLPDQATLIITGQDFVSKNQRVKPIMENSNEIPN